MKRDEVLKEYRVDERGIIRSPGEFEGCHVFAPYFWELAMHGTIEDTQFSAGIPIGLATVLPDDVAEFPELAGVERVAIWKDCVGFVHCLTKAENFPLADGEEGADDD